MENTIELPPIRECRFCELPVPAENENQTYCADSCIDAYVKQEIEQSAVMVIS